MPKRYSEIDMSDKRLDSIEQKLDTLIIAFSEYKVKVESRVTRLETIQKGFTTLLNITVGTIIASFSTVVIYLMKGE